MIILNDICLNFTDYTVDQINRTITLTPRVDHHEHSLVEFCTMGKGEFPIICIGESIKYNVIMVNSNINCFIFSINSIEIIDESHKSKSEATNTFKTPVVRRLEARNAQLLEAVRKAHEILLHEMDNGRTPSMLQGVGLGYFEDVIAGIEK